MQRARQLRDGRQHAASMRRALVWPNNTAALKAIAGEGPSPVRPTRPPAHVRRAVDAISGRTTPCVRTKHSRGSTSDERGSSSIQLVVLMPVMFSVMFLGVQAALYYHAREVAIAAAHEGAREAGSQTGSQQSGVRTAIDFITQAGGDDVLAGSAVTGARSATTATVTVRGTSLSVIPGWNPTISQSSSTPVERLTP